MERFTQQDLADHLGDIAAAAQDGPVAIAAADGTELVVITAETYARMRRSERQAIDMRDLPPEWIDELRKPIDDPKLIALNHLLDDA